jgi:hypothetical protein
MTYCAILVATMMLYDFVLACVLLIGVVCYDKIGGQGFPQSVVGEKPVERLAL